MSYDTDDTIVAIATAGGGGARGMVRVSGPATGRIVAACFVSDDRRPPDSLSRATAIAGSVDVRLGDAEPRSIPCDLYFWPTKQSYTRQVVAEFHTFGSEPVLRAVLETVCRAGARLAEPGEFTLRAFLSGRIDLTQAEAVLGVIDAKQAQQLDAALAQLAGGLARPLHRLRNELLQLLAELEAGLDFVDEDIEFISAEVLVERLEAAAGEIRRVAAQMTSRHTESAAERIVLVGPPNTGKSSLFNALVAKFGSVDPARSADTAAIVSDQRHTTRDYLTAVIDLGGIGCELVDTAGVESQTISDFGSRIAGCSEPGGGQQRKALVAPRPGSRTTRLAMPQSVIATAQAKSAELRTQAAVRAWCVDATLPQAADWMDAVPTGDGEPSPVDVVVLTKADLVTEPWDALNAARCTVPVVLTSSLTGQGLDELCHVLAWRLDDVALDQQSSVVAATADRCRDSLRLAEASVSRAAESAACHRGDELVAAELRVALAELGKVVGTVYTDDLLDRIFKTFCIGK